MKRTFSLTVIYVLIWVIPGLTISITDIGNTSNTFQFRKADMDTVTLQADEEGLGWWHLELDPGDRMGVKYTPPSYPFTVLEAAYGALGETYDQQCKLCFFQDGTESPGKEIAHKTVALDYAWVRWVDASDLNVVINSGSFYVAVELVHTEGPFFEYDCNRPLHHSSWFYDDGTWYSWEQINVTGMSGKLGDSVDMILRVKGLAPDAGIVELEPDLVTDPVPEVTITVSSGVIRYTLPTYADVEISLWDASGRRLETLYSGFEETGSHSLLWDSSRLPSGTYFFCLNTPQVRKTAKVVMTSKH
ncbi:T9SS type A sorting domain-containing protein [candidate division WOR-3 bacterium]|nr:T9SS type A sorting domain-containing protein [candidate division WOR-3 bacterium]